MIDASTSVINWILAIFGGAAILVLFVFYFRINYAKQTIEYLRGDRDDAIVRANGFEKDLENALERHNKEKIDLQQQILNYETTASTQAQEIHILRNVVTGKEQLDRIEQLLRTLSESRFSA